MGLKMKNVNIMWVHQFLGEGGHKKTIYIWAIAWKGDLDNLQGVWQKIGRRVFLMGGWYLNAHYDLILLIDAGT